MQTIHRTNDPTLDRRPDGRICIRFKLNREPDYGWIEAFKAHAGSSALGGTSAIFNGLDVAIDVSKGVTIPEVATALDCFIECANLRLRSLPAQSSQRRPPAAIPPLRVPPPHPQQAVFTPRRDHSVAGRGPNGTRMSGR